MKLLFTDRTNVHCDRYFVCESDKEYEEILEKSCFDKRSTVFVGKFTCHPHVSVSDGYAEYGGREFEADGFEYWYEKGGMTSRFTKSDYFIKPDGIIKDESVKREGWWV